jgi:hypothetical protein
LNPKRDFWLSCGHHLLDRGGDGRLVITDEFLRVYLARPEITPPGDACRTERELYGQLFINPRQTIEPERIAAMADVDARENWALWISWRDHLTRHASLETAYLAIAREGLIFPHLFLNQLVQVILRNVLDGCEDIYTLRAAELFFRPQQLALYQGSLLAADQERASALHTEAPSPLNLLLGLGAPQIEVLGADNAASYWERSDMFDLALDLTASRRGVAALGAVVEGWVRHLLAIEVAVEAVSELRDVAFSWYVGLDAQATRIGDTLWKGDELDQTARNQLIGLYRLTFPDDAQLLEPAGNGPTYLLTAMSTDQVMWLKPQNLITGLPAVASSRATN